jgi:hypothetical protein
MYGSQKFLSVPYKYRRKVPVNHSLKPCISLLNCMKSTCMLTERRGRMVNISTSYSGNSRFKCRPGDRLFWRRFFVVSSVPPGKCWDNTLNYTTAASFHIFPNSRFTHNPFIRRNIVWVTEKASLNMLQNKLRCWNLVRYVLYTLEVMLFNILQKVGCKEERQNKTHTEDMS